LRARYRGIILLTFILAAAIAVGGNSSPVSAAFHNYQYGNCYQNPYCYSPGNYNGNYYTTCQSTGNSNTVQCSGYLYQPSNGCIELAIPIDNGYWFESQVYQYYTLQHLPASYSPSWGWVTVTGQIFQGYNMAPNGALCPGNYIIVNSISP
jgi:hypothetical protein